MIIWSVIPMSKCLVLFVEVGDSYFRRYFITAVDSCKNCDLSLCHLLNFFDDQTGETHSVLKGTTKFVQSLVCSRRKEGAYQIAVCHMDLNCIYACFHGSLCCEAIAFYQFINFCNPEYYRGPSEPSSYNGRVYTCERTDH